jgi:hypothetical protein
MNEIYTAIFSKLNTDLVEPVLGHVPENYDAFPFVKLHPLELNENDTDTETGFSATFNVNCYSRYRGAKEVSELQQSVYNSLHRVALGDTVSYGISTIQQSYSNIVLDSDGLTRIGLQRFTIIFEPLP